MGLIISNEEADARLNNPDNLAMKQGLDPKTSKLQDSYNKKREEGPNEDADQMVSIRPVHNGGRREGDSNVPEVLRNVAAILTNSGETSKSVAQALGVSKSSVDQYKEGNTSFGRPSKEIKSVLKAQLEIIQDKAIEKMLSGINHIDFDDEEKMKKTTMRDVSAILVNLQKLVDPRANEPEKQDSTRLIVYAPTVRNEQHFEVVETRES